MPEDFVKCCPASITCIYVFRAVKTVLGVFAEFRVEASLLSNHHGRTSRCLTKIQKTAHSGLSTWVQWFADYLCSCYSCFGALSETEMSKVADLYNEERDLYNFSMMPLPFNNYDNQFIRSTSSFWWLFDTHHTVSYGLGENKNIFKKGQCYFHYYEESTASIVI